MKILPAVTQSSVVSGDRFFCARKIEEDAYRIVESWPLPKQAKRACVILADHEFRNGRTPAAYVVLEFKNPHEPDPQYEVVDTYERSK